MSYGPHPNDFLFAECKPLWEPIIPIQRSPKPTYICIDGFFLDENDSEAVYLDDIILQDLDASQQEDLYLHQYYGYARPTTETPTM